MIQVRFTGSQLHFKQTPTLTLTNTLIHTHTHTQRMVLLYIFHPLQSSLSLPHLYPSVCGKASLVYVRFTGSQLRFKQIHTDKEKDQCYCIFSHPHTRLSLPQLFPLVQGKRFNDPSQTHRQQAPFQANTHTHKYTHTHIQRKNVSTVYVPTVTLLSLSHTYISQCGEKVQ